MKPAGSAARGQWILAVEPFPGGESSHKGPADSVSSLQELGVFQGLGLSIEMSQTALTALLHVAMFPAYRPKLESSDTEEVFPLRFRGLSKYLLISVP